MTDKTIEQIWVSAKDAADITNYHPRTLDRLVRNMLIQAEDERRIRIRHDETGYHLWLPDLIEFVSEYGAGRLAPEVEEIWVSVTEGMQFTGYSRDHVQKLARDNWALPEDQRQIKTRKRLNGYEMWLPDLIEYIRSKGHGPHNKLK
jgi:hypothetical protein